MPPVLFARTTSWLRLPALAVLVLGLLAKPVLVAACELEDMTRAGTVELVDPAPGLDDACCPGQACGECCTAATMLPLAAGSSQAIPPQAHPQASSWVRSDPAPRVVAHRPPIRG